LQQQPKIIVQGAGLIGGYLGGALAHAGADVTLLGRPAFLDPIRIQGMHLTDLHGLEVQVAPDKINLATRSDGLATADIIFVCVKSSATVKAAEEIALHAPPGALIISFQNGIRNAGILQAQLPHHTVITGMVPFNVMQPAPAHWHRGTDGSLFTTPHPALDFLVPLFEKTSLHLKFHPDMNGVMWSKILLNLNNAVNALSGKPLREELQDRDYRLVLAACIAEALHVLSAAKLVPAQISHVKPAKLPRILRWPNFLYNLLAMRQLKIDARARSSMAEDLAQNRLTEIDDLNGSVVRLAEQLSIKTPVNDAIIRLIKSAEGRDPVRYSGRDLRQTVGI
jgi:2-dehydropantoate 2-reductase